MTKKILLIFIILWLGSKNSFSKNNIHIIAKINDQIIIKNGQKKIIMNLFDKIKIKTSILNYESNLFNKIKFFYIEPNLDSILL